MTGPEEVGGEVGVGVVVLAYGDEPWLADCVDAVLASRGVTVEVVVVDNQGTPADVDRVRGRAGVRVVSPGRNTGFAGGCNLGADALTGGVGQPYLALVNSDCLVDPDALARLAAEAARPGVGPVMASIRLADDPQRLNSAGNPVHVLGTCWAGGLGDPETRTAAYDVAGASGACLLLRRTLWDELEGFDDAYFAYLEDTELSLRCWRRGLAARCVPGALARHHYEFSRNPTKMYLLERNRLLLVSTLWSRRALVALTPLLLAFELGLAPLALAQGWGAQKARAWVWILRHPGYLRARRRRLERERTVDPAVWMRVLTPAFAPHVVGSRALAALLNAVVGAYWRLVLRVL